MTIYIFLIKVFIVIYIVSLNLFKILIILAINNKNKEIIIKAIYNI